jgi:hypothetical protein
MASPDPPAGASLPPIGAVPAMIEGHRVCLTIPAGRQRYLEVLIPQLFRERGWDELQIWVNTANAGDLAYLDGLPELDPRIRLLRLPAGIEPDGPSTICHFFPNCTDSGTVYIRFDDDICYVEPRTVEKLAAFRIAHAKPFLIFPVIINNAIISHILQGLGRIEAKRYIEAYVMDEIGWEDPIFAESLHRRFLKALEEGEIDKFKFATRPIAMSRMSINCIAWRGEEFAKFEGKLGFTHEEEWLSVTRPTQLASFNLIYGRTVVAHFSFYTQRKHLDRTDLLEQYRLAAGV